MPAIDRAWVFRRARALAPLLFALSVVLLIVLTAWWFLLIHRTIGEQHHMRRDMLQLEALLHAEELRDKVIVLVPGPFSIDPRYEIVPAERWAQRSGSLQMEGVIWQPAPLGPQMFLVPTTATLEEMERAVSRRRAMVFGEGSLLVSLLLAVLAMLGALVRAEGRFQAEMETFLGGMTHEMKTPLAGIKAVLQTIALGRMPADRLADLANRALGEVKREEHLIQNLLVAQRMRQPGSRLAHERMDLSLMLRQFVKHRVALPAARDITWQLDAADGVYVICDPSSTRTIVDNLADNSVKYGGNVICIRLRSDDKRAEVTVVDDGIGFDPALAEGLFRAFGRGNSGRAVARAGSGLGLHISRTLAERMGGSLLASSAGDGQGATFTLTLPLAPADGPGDLREALT